MTSETRPDSTFDPRGPHDRRLLENVRPSDWTNPDPRDRYDLLVLGAGTGGLVSAAIGAALGARVALVEKRLLGGDCLNYGCVPSKGVLRSARSWAEARSSHERFHGPKVTREGDFAGVMNRMRRLRADISEVDGAERFRSMGVDIFFGTARFLDREHVAVDGLTLRFRRAILATGGRPAMPPIDGLSEVDALTNETVFGLTELPDELLVLGAGPIGTELAHAFARFGSRVTVVDRGDRPLHRDEPEASTVALRTLEKDGVRFLGGATVSAVRTENGRKTVTVETEDGTEELSGDAILVALGRVANTDLSLEASGIEYDGSGVKTDDRLRTTNRRVYAVGDVAGRHQFTHVADAHARMAVRNALFFGRGRVSDLIVPMCTYLEPEVARVGPTREELEADGLEVETIRIDFNDVDRAKLDGAVEGFLMVHLEAGGDDILGATVVGDNAGDIISLITQAMTLDIGLENLGEVIFPYPTVAEVVRKAADARRREKLTPRTRTFFDWFFRLSRHLP